MKRFLLLCLFFSRAIAADEVEPDYKALTIKLRETLLAEGYGPRPGALFNVERATKTKETWCFLGDSGVVGQAQKNVSQHLLRKNRPCDRIYHLGDMVYPTGITSQRDPALRERFLAYHEPFSVPFFYVLGDHEYYGLKITPWLDVAKGYGNLNFPFYFYGHDSGGVCLVAADTTPFYRGRMSDPKAIEQMEWFERELPKHLGKCSFKIFVGHHSFETMNSERKPPKDEYKAPLREFFEHHVLGKFDVIFSGHDHALAYIGNFKGTEQYVSGAGGKYTKAGDDRMDFEHYVGHAGPGAIYLDIFNRKPFRGEIRIMALEGKVLNKKRLVFRKSYRK
jgi:hypothetical protein